MYKRGKLPNIHTYTRQHTYIVLPSSSTATCQVREELCHPTMRGETMMHKRQCFYYRMGGS